MRKSPALLTWSDVDLERGAVMLDKNKTDEARAWALTPGVVNALSARRERCEENALRVDDGFRSGFVLHLRSPDAPRRRPLPR